MFLITSNYWCSVYRRNVVWRTVRILEIPIVVVPLPESNYRQFDTPCLFGRDIARFEDVVTAWYGSTIREPKLPDVSRLTYADGCVGT